MQPQDSAHPAPDQRADETSVRRTVAILFGHPFETPTIDEMGMQFAYSTALRSSDLSRQVGYAACTDDGQVLAVGTNEVAKARLFRDSIALESADSGKVLFEPFVGIAPPRFRDFFLMPVRKDDDGRIISWDEIKRSSLPNIESDPRLYIRSERASVEDLGKALADAGVTFRESRN